MDMFIDEAGEYLEILSGGLLRIEKSSHDKALLAEMFRAAHTLKGMSGTVGLNDIALISHELEDVLQAICDEQIKVDTGLVSLMLEAIEQLEVMLDAPKEEHGDKVNELINYLKSVKSLDRDNGVEQTLDSKDRIALEPDKKSIVGEHQKKGYYLYRIDITLDKGVPIKEARVYMIFKALEEHGFIIQTVPHARVLEEGCFDNWFVLFFLSKNDPEDIETIGSNISDIVEFKVTMEQEINEKKANEEVSKENVESNQLGIRYGNQKTMRVETERMDKLVTLVEELMINRTVLIGLTDKMSNASGEWNTVIGQFERITRDLQNAAMSLRMVQVGQLFSKFPKMVRNIAHNSGKEVELIIHGETTELDRSIVNRLGDPLVHLIRNAVDHGILDGEKGNITLSAYHEGGNIVIEVSDNGKGMDSEVIRAKAIEKGIINEDTKLENHGILDLIFHPGFSTAEKITDISGRGVGMDVVKTTVDELKGSVSISSTKGKGTKFSIKLPLTLAIIRALIVSNEGDRYAIPVECVKETLKLSKYMVKTINGKRVLPFREKVIPLIDIEEALGNSRGNNVTKDISFLVITDHGEKTFGLFVDEIVGQQDIVVKSVSNMIGSLKGISGVAILGDGKVAMILDTWNLI